MNLIHYRTPNSSYFCCLRLALSSLVRVLLLGEADMSSPESENIENFLFPCFWQKACNKNHQAWVKCLIISGNNSLIPKDGILDSLWKERFFTLSSSSSPQVFLTDARIWSPSLKAQVTWNAALQPFSYKKDNSLSHIILYQKTKQISHFKI